MTDFDGAPDRATLDGAPDRATFDGAPDRATFDGAPDRATIVVATNGRASLLNAYRELARRLRAAGHRVVIVTGAAVAAGLDDWAAGDVVALDHDRRFDEAVALDRPPPPTRPLAVAAWVGRRRRLRARSIDGTEVLEAIESVDPDLVILDAEFQVGVLATTDLAVPRVLAMTFFSIFTGPDLPPLNTDLGPPTGAIDRLRVRLAWHRLHLGAHYTRLRRRFSRAGLAALLRPMPLDSNDPADLRALARNHGVDLGAIADRGQWLRPHLARHLPVLCANAAEMDLPHEPSPRLEYLGPLVWFDRPEPDLTDDDRDRLTGLLDAHRRARADGGRHRPLTYATLGTYPLDDRRLLDAIIGAFAARPDWDLVLGLGGTVEVADLTPLPANVLALAWAPQSQILAEADAVVAHGGSGTLREAIHHGVPLVVFPTGHGANDQPGNGARVLHHRLGVVHHPKTVTTETVHAAIEAVLTDPTIAAGVARMSDVVRAATDDGRAVAVVERHLRPAVPGPTDQPTPPTMTDQVRPTR